MITPEEWEMLRLHCGFKASDYNINEQYHGARIQYFPEPIVLTMTQIHEERLYELNKLLNKNKIVNSISVSNARINIYLERKSFIEIPIEDLEKHVS